MLVTLLNFFALVTLIALTALLVLQALFYYSIRCRIDNRFFLASLESLDSLDSLDSLRALIVFVSSWSRARFTFSLVFFKRQILLLCNFSLFWLSLADFVDQFEVFLFLLSR